MFLGIGTTVEHFARLAAGARGPDGDHPVAGRREPARHAPCRVIIAGGLVRQDELTCIGASAVECVRRYNTDTAVIGAAGLSARRGVTELDDREADVIRGGLEKTERIIVIADGSKFGDVAMSTVVPIERVAAIVTDAERRPGRDRADQPGGRRGDPGRARRPGPG